MTDENTKPPEAAASPAQPYRRFTLLPDGLIALQIAETNPLPGPGVARLKAGPHWAHPDFDVLPDSLIPLAIQPADAEAAIRTWLAGYITETLPFLKEDAEAPEGVKPMLAAIADQGGIAERAKLTLPELDPAARFYLRSKGMRLGPVHLYYQNLLKPAPLMLRALLWATHKGLSHPLPYPRAGVTSYSWPEGVTPDAEVQHWFGYPLYARRGCRVDRIDKIVCDVYETAAKGVFPVKHAWAEWLGCKVEEVCTLLTELGHTRVTPPPAEGDEDAAKATIEFRLKSDRPAVARAPRERTERTPRPDRKPREDRKPRDDRKPREGGENVKKFDRNKAGKKGDRGPDEKKKFVEKPLMASPFANLKDMLGG